MCSHLCTIITAITFKAPTIPQALSWWSCGPHEVDIILTPSSSDAEIETKKDKQLDYLVEGKWAPGSAGPKNSNFDFVPSGCTTSCKCLHLSEPQFTPLINVMIVLKSHRVRPGKKRGRARTLGLDWSGSKLLPSCVTFGVMVNLSGPPCPLCRGGRSNTSVVPPTAGTSELTPQEPLRWAGRSTGANTSDSFLHLT